MVNVDDIQVDGQTLGLKIRVVALDWGYAGIYGHSSTSYAGIPIQIMLPKRSDIDGFTKIEAKLVIDYETEGASTMGVKLVNFTNLVDVAGFEITLPNQTWGHGSSGWVDITSVEGKSLRIYTKRIGGSGTNNVKIEGAVLLLKYS
jgi:hypothetical protein